MVGHAVGTFRTLEASPAITQPPRLVVIAQSVGWKLGNPRSPIPSTVRVRSRAFWLSGPRKSVEPNPSRLQNRQAHGTHALVGSTPAPLRWRNPCKSAYSGGWSPPGIAFHPAGLGTGRGACRRRSRVDAVRTVAVSDRRMVERFSVPRDRTRHVLAAVSGVLVGTVQNVGGAMGAQNLGRRRPGQRRLSADWRRRLRMSATGRQDTKTGGVHRPRGPKQGQAQLQT
jgi:hypothetical protein